MKRKLTAALAAFMLALLVIAAKAQAATLVGIITPQNTADVLSGAHAFLLAHPKQKIILRSTEQFADLTQLQRQQLLQQADMVFVGGVFGDTVNSLMQYLQTSSTANSFVAIHSDRRLVQASHIKGRSLLAGADIDALMADAPVAAAAELAAWSQQQLKQYPDYQTWLLAKMFWANRDAINSQGLLSHLFYSVGESIAVPTPKFYTALRFVVNGKDVSSEGLTLSNNKRWVALLDYESGDRPGEKALHDAICLNMNKQGLGCLRVLAKWGEHSVAAVKALRENKQQLAAIISLQNFVVGAGEGREEVNRHLAELNVPVLKGIRLSDSTKEQWLLSEEGLSASSVHYRVAMPELQGVIEPLVLAAMTEASIDPQTGVKLASSKPISSQVDLLSQRLQRWLLLQSKANHDKKIAIIYYNHPPGRHNIGADNLNVPASLFHLLQQLKKAGYNTGELPASEQDLLDLLQAKGVNLPEDRQALATMATQVATVSMPQYKKWFASLPLALQQEMSAGPLAYLHVMLQRAIGLEDQSIGRGLLARVLEDLHHAIDGADHPARERVIQLLKQLQQVYTQAFDGQPDWPAAQDLVTAIAESGIEGLRGWGELPGKVMVHEQQLLIPGLQFGNIFVGPQPPRGWELNEELLHANLSFPPPHQYLAFYLWLRHSFQADALVHLGRHSTYEFLPRRRVGMSAEDYSLAVLGDIPSIYPYIVDGVGEGIQAKRRGLAVMIDHLTPPLDSTDLYDRLLALRQLVESYEAAPVGAGAMRERAVSAMKALVDELKLRDELVASMSGELAVRGITDFDQVDDELLVHEIGHYLTKLQEDFMPLGLHVFGRDWSQPAIATMLNSMAQGEAIDPLWQQQLSASPAAELSSLLHALAGQYIAPGKGNDPIRTPEVLPTGRNFFALDGSLIPSRLAYQVGVELAAKARAKTAQQAADYNSQDTPADAIVLWASDVVRDEGAMIAFGFDMLGVKPVWSSRGIVKSLQRLDISNLQENGQPRVRHDAVFTTSGLFRDLYGSHMLLLERAVLMALDASAERIHKDYPALSYALNATLKPLGAMANSGNEALAINHVAARWVADTRAALQQGLGAELAGKQAAYRVFGDAPGTYGAGVNRMVERSGSWQQRSEIASVYMRRLGHAYGQNLHGEPVLATFKQRLSSINNTYLGRASNLYGLLDNNDSFDYLGGLSLAVETLTGSAPENFVIYHPDTKNLSIEPLQVALLAELRGRYLNPQWLSPLMDEGYAGARTMGSEFLEYLWGWQVTNPEVIKSWVWDEVKAVYIDDKLNLNLDNFLEQGHNVHVKSNMLAVMLVAAQKDFWQADEQTLQQLAKAFADLVLAHGLPGSGHTSPNHPLYPWLENYLAADQYVQLQQLLAATKVDASVNSAASVVAEISLKDITLASKEPAAKAEKKSAKDQFAETKHYYWLAVMVLLLLLIGAYRGSRTPKN
ncbi:cobaltochelatase subunit CobN [Dasania marina]|uniref:cobaltochelatase subunit CobN n=1 Tax=Dasania marina TaxID=471499 RepID=UPI0030D7EE80|tara:strand:- start:33109 stop:37452 length:4344 start_codon:yes stop_codon:yes gene_type:complete